MAHTCPNCDTQLSPDTTTITDGNEAELDATDAVRILAQSGNQMLNILLECDACGWKTTRTVTVRSHN